MYVCILLYCRCLFKLSHRQSRRKNKKKTTTLGLVTKFVTGTNKLSTIQVFNHLISQSSPKSDRNTIDSHGDQLNAIDSNTFKCCLIQAQFSWQILRLKHWLETQFVQAGSRFMKNTSLQTLFLLQSQIGYSFTFEAACAFMVWPSVLENFSQILASQKIR